MSVLFPFTAEREAVEKAIEYVRSGNGALVFPEGTRTKDGNLGRLKSGVFVIASQAHAPIIPCRLIYRGGKPGLFRRCTVVFGKPIPAETLDMGDTYSMARLRECKKPCLPFCQKGKDILRDLVFKVLLRIFHSGFHPCQRICEQLLIGEHPFLQVPGKLAERRPCPLPGGRGNKIAYRLRLGKVHLSVHKSPPREFARLCRPRAAFVYEFQNTLPWQCSSAVSSPV